MASEPTDDNVFEIEDFSELDDVQRQLLTEATCYGRWSPLIFQGYIFSAPSMGLPAFKVL